MYYVYVIQNEKNKRYTGQTDNIAERLQSIMEYYKVKIAAILRLIKELGN
jgi:predicted GIY-YIG superfamily endonuclease